MKDFLQRLTVMHEGRIIADGGYEECLRHPEVRRSYWQIDVSAESKRTCLLTQRMHSGDILCGQRA